MCTSNSSGTFNNLYNLPCLRNKTIQSADPRLQQEYDSRFVATLRNGGGGSAYVPTTAVYSTADEIVQPQTNPNASAFVDDQPQRGRIRQTSGAITSNTELQQACPPPLAGGGPFLHEGVLYSSLAFALAKDALTNDGPGNLARLNLTGECLKGVADGLDLQDVLQTEEAALVALLGIIGYPQKVSAEPAIASYAQKDAPRGV